MSAPCRKAWCKKHTEDGENGQPIHQGSASTVPVPDGAITGLDTLLSAQLYADEFYDVSEVWVRVGEYDEFPLRDGGIIALAEKVEAFARRLREMADEGRAPSAIETGRTLAMADGGDR